MLIAWCVTGSFCTISRACAAMEMLKKEGNEIIPLLSPIVQNSDTRFGSADEVRRKIYAVTGKDYIKDVVEAEPFGPFNPPDIVIAAPCTGNTLAKAASGITDTSVTMTIKAQLRCDRPVLIALCSNDALSSNLGNLSLLMNRKGVYFLPMIQDDPKKKPHSAIADFNLLSQAVSEARQGRQMYPLFLNP